MLTLKTKPKFTQRKERNDDLSIITSIQRFKKQPVEKIGSRQRGGPHRGQHEGDEENRPGPSHDWLGNRGKSFANPRTGSVSLSCVPNLITASETRNILHSVPTNVDYKNSQSQDCPVSSRRSQNTRPASRNATSTWAVYSSEVVTRNQPSLNLDTATTVDDSGEEQFPLWFQNMVKLPGTSDTESVRSSKSKRSILSSKATVIQGSWIGRNSACIALTDPKVSIRYSIAELMDIFCGIVPPPDDGLFIRPQQIYENNNPVGQEESPILNLKNGNKMATMQKSRPLRRQLLKDFDDVDSSKYFGDQHLFGDESVSASGQHGTDTREKDRPKRMFFNDLDQASSCQDFLVPSTAFRPTNYFDDMEVNRNLKQCDNRTTSRSVLDFSTGKSEVRKQSSSSRSSDFFNIGNHNNFNKKPSHLCLNTEAETVPFSVIVRNNNIATPLNNETYNHEFKIPSAPLYKRSSSAKGILGVLEANNTGQGTAFNLPCILTSTTPRSSIRRQSNNPDSQKKKKSKLRFADFDPIPKSQVSQEDSMSIDLPEEDFQNSFILQQPETLPHALTSFQPQFAPYSSDVEVSAYNFEARMNARNNSYPGGLGIIQSNYSSVTLDFEGSDTNKNKFDDYLDPYA